MSDADKRDPERGLGFVEKLLVEDEAERIEKLSGDELRAELRAAGVDPARVPDGKELQRRLLAGGNEKRRRRCQRRRACADAPKGEPRRPDPTLAAHRVAPGRRARHRHPVRADVDPRSSPASTTSGNTRDEAPRPTRHEAAENLRDEAMDRCAQAAWNACRDKLDEAARLDPAGESEPRVKKSRADITRRTQGRRRRTIRGP